MTELLRDRIARQIEERIAAGALPCRDPYIAVRKPSLGDRRCAACEEPIAPMAVEYTCEFLLYPTISFHFECFREWQEQASWAIDAGDPLALDDR